MLFSIIIPAFNASATIRKCLDSLAKQNFTDFETIVVNDCSTDDTKKIVAQYRVKQIVLKVNSGPAAARNAGIKAAKGEIIVFIDSDVAFRDSDALVKLDKVFKNNKKIDGAIMIKDKVPLNSGLTPLYWAYYKFYLWNQPGTYQTSFTTERAALKKYVFQKIGFFNEKYKKADVEDFEFGYRMNDAGLRVLIAREIKVLHHFETFQQSIKKTWKRSRQWIRLFLKRKAFDPVYSTRERGIKTLIGGAITPMVIISCLLRSAYPLLFTAIIFMILNFGFYLFLIREKKTILIAPFVFLDILFCTIASASAGLSVITNTVKNE